MEKIIKEHYINELLNVSDFYEALEITEYFKVIQNDFENLKNNAKHYFDDKRSIATTKNEIKTCIKNNDVYYIVKMKKFYNGKNITASYNFDLIDIILGDNEMENFVYTKISDDDELYDKAKEITVSSDDINIYVRYKNIIILTKGIYKIKNIHFLETVSSEIMDILRTIENE